MKRYELDFVFKGTNYIVNIESALGEFTIAKVVAIDEQADLVELDGDLPAGLENRIADEYAELLCTGTGY